LWHDGRVVIIDVSQSVEKEHPRALEFLRMDAQNITDYFRRQGVTVMTPRELFDYVVHASLPTPEEEATYVQAALERALARGAGMLHDSAEAEVAHGVFMAAYIPHSLMGVTDAELETAKLAAGDTSDMYYAALTGVAAAPIAPVPPVSAPPAPAPAPATATSAAAPSAAAAVPASAPAAAPAPACTTAARRRSGSSSSSSSGSGSGSGSDSDGDGEGGGDGGGGGGGEASFVRRAATKEERKAHKAAVKEAKKEKRRTKVPKKDKRRHEKAGSAAKR